jgi:hypothetical protein
MHPGQPTVYRVVTDGLQITLSELELDKEIAAANSDACIYTLRAADGKEKEWGRF